MRRARFRIALAAAVLLTGCGSAPGLTADELAGCLEDSLAEGSLGGSEQIVSSLVDRLPPDAIAPAGTPAGEREAVFDAAFTDLYGISVDEFLTLRGEADAAATADLGDPPAVGERATNEWFLLRDRLLLELWNERHPASAAAYCELVG